MNLYLQGSFRNAKRRGDPLSARLSSASTNRSRVIRESGHAKGQKHMRIISARNLSSATSLNQRLRQSSKNDFHQRHPNTNVPTTPNLSNEASPKPARVVAKGTIKTMFLRDRLQTAKQSIQFSSTKGCKTSRRLHGYNTQANSIPQSPKTLCEGANSTINFGTTQDRDRGDQQMMKNRSNDNSSHDVGALISEIKQTQARAIRLPTGISRNYETADVTERNSPVNGTPHLHPWGENEVQT